MYAKHKWTDFAVPLHLEGIVYIVNQNVFCSLDESTEDQSMNWEKSADELIMEMVISGSAVTKPTKHIQNMYLAETYAVRFSSPIMKVIISK